MRVSPVTAPAGTVHALKDGIRKTVQWFLASRGEVREVKS